MGWSLVSLSPTILAESAELYYGVQNRFESVRPEFVPNNSVELTQPYLLVACKSFQEQYNPTHTLLVSSPSSVT